MDERYQKAIAVEALVSGGMKAVRLSGRDVVICCDSGRFYAVERRCGHMSAPLEKGTLVGTVLTCPMHCAQFDVTTGEALAGPIPHDWGTEPPPPKIGQHLTHISALMADIKTQSLRTYKTRVESGFVWVASEE